MGLWLIIGISIAVVLFALFLVGKVLKRSTGTAEMQNISHLIKEGAESFLARQNKTIGILAAVLIQ